MKRILKKIKFLWSNSFWNKNRFEKSKRIAQRKYNNSNNITILSPNCIGGEIYNLLGLKFQSPLINTSFDRNDFVKFVERMDEYLAINPIVEKKKDGTCQMKLVDKKLEQIIINFPHDNNIDVVLSNWNRRKQRVDKNNIYVICDDRGISRDNLIKLNKLPLKKIIIFSSKDLKIDNNYVVNMYKGKKSVGKYNVKGMDGLYVFQHFFDYAQWLSEDVR